MVVCYVWGVNPPQNVMEGFIHQIWGKYGVESVDKVSTVRKGILMVKFKTMENFQKEISGAAQFFHSKLLIVELCSADVNYAKDPVKQIPILIKLPGLDVKYWGEKILYKIAGQVGKAIKVDQATQNRGKLLQKFKWNLTWVNSGPKSVTIVNEMGV